MKIRRPCLTLFFLALLAVAAFGCGGGTGQRAVVQPVPTPSVRVIDLKKRAEEQVLPQLAPALQDWVRAQEFFTALTKAEYDMLEALRHTETMAARHGATATLMSTLRLVVQQPWVLDGFSDDEAKNVTGLLRAYEASLDPSRPDIADVLPSTIRGNLFQTLSLPETGEVTVLIGTDYEPLGPSALNLVVAELPKVEALAGKFPYTFLYVWVLDLPEYLAGVSREEFVGLSPDYVEPETVAHEIAHATLYGLFPTWFEEGFAYFIEAYATGNIASRGLYHKSNLAYLKLPQKLDVAGKLDHSRRNYTSSSAQGFLFFSGLYDIEGIDGLGRIMRALRSKTFNNDNELLRAIVSNAAPENQHRVQQYLCSAVIGLRSGCQ